MKKYLHHTSKNRTSQLGFTLVELLVVIVVIGVLARISTVAYTGAQQRAGDTSVLSDIDEIDVAETSYQVHVDPSPLAYNSANDPGGAIATQLNFSLIPGNVINVATNDTDYCIRGYNLKANKNSITNSFQKESKKNICASLPPT
ncbi:MAG: prepilin-type N-terminal cleavage/methylation domain-containing protein [Candidatus Saccharibacteria bacterium]